MRHALLLIAAAALSGCAIVDRAREVMAEIKAEEARYAELECESYSMFSRPPYRELFVFYPPPEYPAECQAIDDRRREVAAVAQRRLDSWFGGYGREQITIYEADTGRTRTIWAPKGTQVVK